MTLAHQCPEGSPLVLVALQLLVHHCLHHNLMLLALSSCDIVPNRLFGLWKVGLPAMHNQVKDLVAHHLSTALGCPFLGPQELLLLSWHTQNKGALPQLLHPSVTIKSGLSSTLVASPGAPALHTIAHPALL